MSHYGDKAVVQQKGIISPKSRFFCLLDDRYRAEYDVRLYAYLERRLHILITKQGQCTSAACFIYSLH